MWNSAALWNANWNTNIGVDLSYHDRERWLVIAIGADNLYGTAGFPSSVSVSGIAATQLATLNSGNQHLSFWKCRYPWGFRPVVRPVWSGTFSNTSVAVASYDGEPTLVDSAFSLSNSTITNTDVSSTVTATSGNELLAVAFWNTTDDDPDWAGGYIPDFDAASATAGCYGEGVSDTGLTAGDHTVTINLTGERPKFGVICFSVAAHSGNYRYGSIGNEATSTRTASMPITLPPGATTGDLVVVVAGAQGTAYTGNTPSITTGTGWSVDLADDVTYGYRGMIFASKVLTGSGDTPTITWPQASTGTWLAILFPGGGTVDAVAAISGDGTSIDPVTADPGSSAERVWGVFAAAWNQSDPNNTTYFEDWGVSRYSGVPTGYTEQQLSVGHSVADYRHHEILYISKIATASSDNPGALSLNGAPTLPQFAINFGITLSGGSTSYDLDGDVQTYTLTGNAADLVRSLVLTAETGSLLLTGNAAQVLAAREIAAGTGAFLLTGNANTFDRVLLLTGETGSFALTGNAAGLVRALELSAETGGLLLTGNEADFDRARLLEAETGSFTLTGVAANLHRTLLLSAETGAFVLTGNAADLLTGVDLAAETAAFALAGNEVTLVRELLLAAETGSFSLTGIDAALEAGSALTAETGGFALTGNEVTLQRVLVLDAETGTFTLTGNAADLTRGRELLAETGSFALSGNAAGLSRNLLIVADSAQFVLTGIAADLIYSAAAVARFAYPNEGPNVVTLSGSLNSVDIVDETPNSV